MRCLRLSLHHFRAHAERTVAFGPGLNLLYGPNGAGKTNVLEALSYLALTRSFVTSQDAVAVQVGAAHAELTGSFEGERRGPLTVRLLLGGEVKKALFVNGAAVPTLAEHAGRIPLVVLAPQDAALTAGGPEERRRFLNNLIGQARPVYLDDLLRYTRALRQRNELLQSGRSRRFNVSTDLLDAWTEEVVGLGSRIVQARMQALDGFQRHLDAAHERLGARLEAPSFQYEAPVALTSDISTEAIAEALRQKFAAVAARERETGRTLVGPHRDEVTFRLGTLRGAALRLPGAAPHVWRGAPARPVFLPARAHGRDAPTAARRPLRQPRCPPHGLAAALPHLRRGGAELRHPPRPGGRRAPRRLR